jgi:hypothetical protein
MKKLTAIATTKRGSSAFKLINSERFLEALKDFSGNIQISITMIEDDATEKQKCYFRAEILNTFIAESFKQGEIISESYAEELLLHQCQIQKSSINDLTKSELSSLIDNSKIFLADIFGAQLK